MQFLTLADAIYSYDPHAMAELNTLAELYQEAYQPRSCFSTNYATPACITLTGHLSKRCLETPAAPNP